MKCVERTLKRAALSLEWALVSLGFPSQCILPGMMSDPKVQVYSQYRSEHSQEVGKRAFHGAGILFWAA